MNNNAENNEQISKMVKGIRTAVFLSLATNAYEGYQILNDGANSQKTIGLVLGLIGTLLIWQLGRELQAQKKQALFYWFGLIVIGALRLILNENPFTWNIMSMILVALIVVVTLRLTSWARNRSLV